MWPHVGPFGVHVGASHIKGEEEGGGGKAESEEPRSCRLGADAFFCLGVRCTMVGRW